MFYSINCFGQHQVSGTVTDAQTKAAIANANILLKTPDSLLIAYAYTNNNGVFSLQYPENKNKLVLIAKLLGYNNKTITLTNKLASQTIHFNLTEDTQPLDEIIIEGTKRPITIKSDTTIYRINTFKDGTEQVVEDILKKLPGITVEANGLIKFKGKAVTRLLLDNDNIFDANYSVGTKNISSDIIEGVEAIEDYNENPLLKGVKSSEDVAINLKLKKGKTDVSGNTTVGLGVDNKRYLKLNTIVVSKTLKGFGLGSYNTIGENYSPYNFISNQLDIASLSELSQRSSNLLNENLLNTVLPDNKARVNSNIFGSVNTLFKLKSNLSIRINYNIFKDKLLRNENTNTAYTFNNQNINITTNEAFNLRPLIHSPSYKLKYNISKTKLLTSEGKLDYRTVNTTAMGLNNNIMFLKHTKSNDVFLKNNVEFTNRLNTNTVFQTSLNIATNSLPQDVDLNLNSEISQQNINFKRNTVNLNAALLKKIKSNEVAINLGYNFDENFMDSELQSEFTSTINSVNNLHYKISKPYLNLDYKHNLKKWDFGLQLNNEFIHVKLNDINVQNTFSDSFFAIYPELSAKYHFNKTSSLYSTYSLSNQIPEVRNAFSGLVLTDFRSLQNNNFSFNLFNNHFYSLGYNIYDFYNLTQFNIYANYNFSRFGYLSQLNVNNNTTFSTSIVEATNNESYQMGFKFEKYLHFLRSTFNLNTNYSINKYQNLINTSDLRNNVSNNFRLEFKARTGFKGAFNIENKLFLNNNVFTSDAGPSNKFTALRNDFTIKYLRNRCLISVNTQYFKPNLSGQSSDYLFLDARLQFTSKNKKVNYTLIGNNLLNFNTFTTINSSDLSISTFQHNLQERFILLSVGFKF